MRIAALIIGLIAWFCGFASLGDGHEVLSVSAIFIGALLVWSAVE